MRLFLPFFLVISLNCFSQVKNYIIGVKGDTLNGIDDKGLKQSKWINRYDEVRGEPGFEEEGIYKNSRKEGVWRLYNLDGDLIGLENYKWGNKDGDCQYFDKSGALIREEGWKAMNPDKPLDTFEVEDVEHLNVYRKVIVKNTGVAIKHGQWKYYDPASGFILRTETFTLGKLDHPQSAPPDSTATASKLLVKPKEVQDFEKKNAGKKKIKVRDGATN